MVLAELAGGVAERLQELRDGGIFGGQAGLRAGQAHLRQAGSDRRLTGNESRAPRRAALLAVPVGEVGAFPRDAVDVGRAIAHHAIVVAADVKPADVVGHDDKDVGLVVGHGANSVVPRIDRTCGRLVAIAVGQAITWNPDERTWDSLNATLPKGDAARLVVITGVVSIDRSALRRMPGGGSPGSRSIARRSLSAGHGPEVVFLE
jgi:hypothetical protein